MATLLSICQAVAKGSGFPSPTAIVSSTGVTEQRLLQAAQDAGRSIARYPWTVLVKEHTFSTASGTANYALPSDFSFHLNRTLWNRTKHRRMYGPTSPQDWQTLKSGLLTSTIDQRFRIKVDSAVRYFYIDPTPTATETVAFEYVSDQWCQSSGGSGQTAWAADTDVPLLDDFLLELDMRWRFLNMNGLPYSEEREEADRQIDMAQARDGGAAVLSVDSVRLTDEVIIPETGFGS